MKFVSKLVIFAVMAVLLSVSCKHSTSPGDVPNVASVTVKLVTEQESGYWNTLEDVPRNANLKLKFEAVVDARNGASDEIAFWEITGQILETTRWDYGPNDTCVVTIGMNEVSNTIVVWAVSKFNTSKKGQLTIKLKTFEGESAGEQMLLNTLYAATALRDNTIVSNNGGLDCPYNSYWVPASVMSRFSDHIASIQTLLIKGDPFDYEDVALDLQNAIKDFQNDMERGKQLDKTNLNSKIVEADTLLAITPFYANMGENDVAYGVVFINNAGIRDGLENANAAAKLISLKADASQNEINDSVESLQTAILLFRGARLTGKNPNLVNKTELQNALTAAIAALQTAVTATSESVVPLGQKWVTIAEYLALNSAIESGNTVFNRMAASQEEINAEIARLNGDPNAMDKPNGPNYLGAIKVFENARDAHPLGTMINKSAYNTARAETEEYLAETFPSTDGTDISASSWWATAANIGTLQAALTANTEDAGWDQTDYNTAAAVLGNANAAFTAVRYHGEMISKTRLNNNISDADSLLSRTIQAENASNVYIGTMWATEEAITAFSSALNRAKAVRDRASDTWSDAFSQQTDIDAATSELISAITIFDGQRAEGEKEVGIKSALIAAINAAEDKVYGVLVLNIPLENQNQTVDEATVQQGRKWLYKTEMDSFTEAINAAKVVRDDPAADQTTIDNATADIEMATTNLTLHEGTLLYKEELRQAISDARTAAANVIVYNNNNTPPDPIQAGQKWVAVISSLNTINTAITTAQGILNTASTQTAIDDAAADIKTALNVFNAVLHVKANVTALSAGINSAITTRENIKPSTTGGSEYYKSEWWVPQALWNDLGAAIILAETARDDAAKTQGEINQVLDDLQAAIQAVEDGKQEGTKSSAGVVTIGYSVSDDMVIDLDLVDNVSLNKDTALTVYLADGLTAKWWILDGGSFAYTDPFSVQIPTYNLSIAKHSLTVVVVDAANVPYSMTVYFTVRN